MKWGTVAEILRPHHPVPHLLSELAPVVGGQHRGIDPVVTGVSLHTGFTMPGDIFVALAGVHRHGAEFWPDASAHGAVAILTDQAGLEVLGVNHPPVILVENPRTVLGELSAAIYGTTTLQDLRVFAVTGTNGKTSTAYLVDALMRGLEWTTALSTTAERHVAMTAYPSTLTTPEAPDIHAMLALATELGARGVALEVSAQAIARHRLDGVVATVAGFTNLSHDHFEDFGNMDNYFLAKAKLFTPELAHQAVVCVDTVWGVKLATTAPIPVTTIGGVAAQPVDGVPHWVYTLVGEQATGSVFELTGPGGHKISLHAPIIGDHMVANAALAAVMLIQSGVKPNDLESRMGHGTTGIPVFLPGRIERVSGATGPQVFVDAGRSEDAYRATLATIRARTTGRLVMVCGTSGNRDATKRPLMGAAAAELADVVIVTDDDPRKEDPAVIRAGLLKGAHSVAHAVVHEIPDPTEAIRFAVGLVGEGDSILWSGPGSQSYRDIGGKKVPYSARHEARLALSDAGWSATQETHE